MIEYHSVSKKYCSKKNTTVAVDNVSLNIQAGELVVFLGSSGCGKTTLLRLTNRLEKPTEGQIYIDGRNIDSMNEVKLRQSMGYVIQEVGLFPNKTIEGNIAVVPKLLKWEKDRIATRVRELLEMVNLDPEVYCSRYPIELSGGQQQRIGVIRALAADPNILLMDEPFGAIDPINRDQIQDEFLALQAKLKKTILFVSHDIHEAIKMADKIAIFDQGQLIQFDSPEMLLTQPKNRFVAEFVGSDRALKVLGLLRVEDVMDPNPKNVVPASMSVQEASNFLGQNGFDEGMVVEGDKLVGVIQAKQLQRAADSTKAVMEPVEISLAPESNLRDALSNMLVHDTTDVCVINDHGELQGAINYASIQQHVVELYQENS